MKKLTLAALAAIALVGAGIALADRTVTYTLRSADARTVSMSFYPLPDGGAQGNVCGQTTFAAGGSAPPTCHGVELTGAFRTSVTTMMTGAALTHWKTQEGL